jgi:hypothetical protein
MVKRKRDFKAEYRRRIERALAKGLSKAQARGHRRATEPRVAKSRAEKALEDAKLQMGLRYLRKDKNFSKAAKEAHISPERLRTYAEERGLIEKHGRRWIIKQNLPRRVLVYGDGREHIIIVGNFKAASLVGKYMSAVGSFVRTADISYLRPFIGKAVKDTDGKSYILETRQNFLYRISHADGSNFQQIYRILV